MLMEYITYVNIMTGETIYVANMELIYWSVRSSNRRGGDGVNRVDGGIVILAYYKFHFIREHDNLV